MFEKLTAPEMEIIGDILDSLENIVHINPRTLKIENWMDWRARTKEHRRALWRLHERGFLEVSTSYDYGYHVQKGEAISAHRLLPAFWQWLGMAPETIVINITYRNMQYILHELENDLDYQYPGELPSYRIMAWQVSYHDRYGITIDAAMAWNLERQRIANNRRIQEEELQQCEQFLSRIETQGWRLS